MTVRPYFRAGAGFVHKWIVLRRRSIRLYAHDLTEIVVECLCHVAAGEVFAIADEQIAVGGLRYAAAEMGAVRCRGNVPSCVEIRSAGVAV